MFALDSPYSLLILLVIVTAVLVMDVTLSVLAWVAVRILL